MTTQYETLRHEDTYREAFGVEPPAALGERLLWPRKPGCFIVHQAVATALLSPEPAAPLAAGAVEFNAADDAAATPPADRSRLLPETDPFSRQIMMSHGTFLELLDLAARRFEVRTTP